MGGVDLSVSVGGKLRRIKVPARVGGVDLSLNYLEQMGPEGASPPVWAGWI